MMLPVVKLSTTAGMKRTADQTADFDIDPFATLKDFEARLSEYLKEQDTRKRDMKQHERKRYKMETGASASSVMWDDSVFESVLTRCKQTEFWDTESMEKIVEKRALPTRFLPQLFECIFKHEAPSLIKCVSNQNVKVHESILIESLKFVLRSTSSDDDLIDSLSQLDSWMECPLPHDTAKNILDIMRFPFVEEILQVELTKLWPNEVLCFIQFLQYLQHRISPALECEEKFNKQTSFPIPQAVSEELVHTWLDLTLNVHLPTLISSNKFLGVVKMLKKFVHDQIKFNQELQSCEPLVEHISTGDVTLPQAKKSNALYTYKTLTL